MSKNEYSTILFNKSPSNHEINRKIDEIKREYEYYKFNSEKHPLYTSTWQIFWTQRYNELQHEGIMNPDKYDYKVEWIKYWMEYIKEYYEFKIKFYSQNIEENVCLSPITVSSDSNHETSISSDSSSPDSSPLKRPSKYRPRQASLSTESFEKSEIVASNDAITVLSVCRLLSALEFELGSLISNKIIDLIAQIIELERIEANSSDEIILNGENVIFLETVKEKLKGLVLTNLLEPRKIPVVKKCIQTIAQLVHQNPVNFSEAVAVTSDQNNETYSRLMDIILKALVHFGKTDVTDDELEVIKEIYFEELEKNIKRPSNIDVERQAGKLIKSNSFDHQNWSDEELKTAIKSFRQLTDVEQQNLIDFITKLEEKEPDRVSVLQNLFNQNTNDNSDSDDYDFNELLSSIV